MVFRDYCHNPWRNRQPNSIFKPETWPTKHEQYETGLLKVTLISKGLFGILNSSKKKKEKLRPNYYDTSGWIVFVRFLEELKTPKRHFEINWPPSKSTDVFVRRYWCFCHNSKPTNVLLSWTLKIWILVIFMAALASQIYKLWKFKAYSISKHFSVTKIQILKFRKIKCSSFRRYDKNISIFWQKSTFKQHGDFYLQIILFNISSFVKYCQEFINIPCQ